MLLPSAERRGEIQFYIAKGLPYGKRLTMAFVIMTAGLAFQVAFADQAFWLGIPLVLLGVLLLLSKGYQNKVERTKKKSDWRPARREEVERIITLNAKQKKWDAAAIDVTCARGFFALAGMAFLVFVAFLYASDRYWNVGIIVAANGAVMLLPFWFTGVRSILKNDKLVTKAEMMLRIEEAFNRVKQANELFQYQLQTNETKEGAAPADVKALITFPEGPASFLGMQLQVSINSVQGKDYPYFYCVLVARPEFGGFNKMAPALDNTVYQKKREGDVDIVVIRQRTTKNSGYHTKQKVADKILLFTLGEARRLLSGKS